MDLNKAIARLERYRDDIVTHGMTRQAISTVIEAAQRELHHRQHEEGSPE